MRWCDQAASVVLGQPAADRAWRSTRSWPAATCCSRTSPAWARRCWPRPWPGPSAARSAASRARPTCCPSDLTGVTYLDDDRRTWVFRPGPLFHNVVLVDEINRATPRTQSALLEAMAEGQVTVDGTTHPLPDPFLVVATQNPQLGDPGTFPLVAGQRDRFAVSLSLGLPGRAGRAGAAGRARAAPRPRRRSAPIAELDEWVAPARPRSTTCTSTPRSPPTRSTWSTWSATALDSRQPISPRAALVLVQLARAHALSDGRDHVRPDDVQAVAVAALAHRIVDATNDDLTTARTWIADFLRQVPVPAGPGWLIRRGRTPGATAPTGSATG